MLAAGACATYGASVCPGSVLAAAASRPPNGPPATLSASFAPEHLGAPTTVSFAVNIDPPASGVPLALAAVTISYPSDLGLATSGLGLASCEASVLEQQGPAACPPNAKMGQGSALVEVPFGPAIVKESVSLQLYAAPSNDGYIHLAILAHGEEPVLGSVVLPGVLYPGQVQITVPAIPSLPEAHDVALLSLHVSLGGALTYYEDVHGRSVAYTPRGIGLPDTCPHGGFKLAAAFIFTDGQSSSASTVIGCPRAAHHHRMR
ncbi:MAG TPA: hypothetical protein VMB51_12120 [Solirubrobacteraceae bacterium]|nr:hypothetical protein [Solirubrobacteraceae bacterium]